MASMINVGEKYPLFENLTKKMLYQDGGVLEALDDQGGFWYNMYLNAPHDEEIKLITTETVHVRLLKEGEFILPLIKFGDTMMIFEMSFDPTLYQDKRAFQLVENNNVLTIVLIDSRSGVVKGLRQANFPLKFINTCIKYWKQAFTIKNYAEKYKKWYETIQTKSLEHLWMAAEDAGILGEKFHLEDIEKS